PCSMTMRKAPPTRGSASTLALVASPGSIHCTRVAELSHAAKARSQIALGVPFSARQFFRRGKIQAIMERKLEEIASAALQMSVESRAALAKRLLDSL